MSNPFYSYSPIVDRPIRSLPAGKRIAVWIGLNIEHYEYGKPALSVAQFTADLTPDPLNFGWREYGPRVGVWRMIEMFDRLGIQPTAILNSEVIEQHPAIVAAGVERGWAWVGHGKNNSTWQVGMEREQEKAYLTEVADRIEGATGKRPKGWLGPSITAGPETNNLLAEVGYQYCLDWGIDDEPFPFDVAGGTLVSVPYSTELNDIPFYALRGQTGPDFKQALIDQFDQMYAEGETRPRIMGFGLHPFLSGQPFRLRYVAEALEHMVRHEDVWFANSDDVAEWYLGGDQ
ncbi:polysaccharide deacetylase family protein [Nocardia sp. NPDC050408]|uniref:polysaccharide deacetylase family protein n=1 Tax=Nocardia sp. NPDC050408 TaxID=3364319 RepID=UPI0037A44DDF